jgi:hypothetical protein
MNTGNRAGHSRSWSRCPTARVSPRETRIGLEVGAIAERTVDIRSAGRRHRRFIDRAVLPRWQGPTGPRFGRRARCARARQDRQSVRVHLSVALATGPDGPQEAWSASIDGPFSDASVLIGCRIRGRLGVEQSGCYAWGMISATGQPGPGIGIVGDRAGHRVRGSALTGAGIAGNRLRSSVRADHGDSAVSATPS